MKSTAEAVPRPGAKGEVQRALTTKVSAAPQRLSDHFEAIMPGRATLESKAVRFRILYDRAWVAEPRPVAAVGLF